MGGGRRRGVVAAEKPQSETRCTIGAAAGAEDSAPNPPRTPPRATAGRGGSRDRGWGALSTALRVVAVWLVVNVLLVAVWAGVGWFARRARGEIRRRRAEVAFTALGTAAVLATLSLVNPGVRHAVSPIVNSALGLTRNTEGHVAPGSTRIPTTSIGSTGPGRGPITTTGPGNGRAGVSPDPRPTRPILERRIPPGQPSSAPSPSPSPAACPSDGPAPTGSTGPSSTPEPTPSPCPGASPSPDASPTPST
jgi:hypothetical protein